CRSGHDVVLHPEVAGAATRPDFLVTGDEGERFYLEAVSVGERPTATAEARRLADVHRVLHDMQDANFALALHHYNVGPHALATKPLRAALRRWLDELDPDVVTASIDASPEPTFDVLPRISWS